MHISIGDMLYGRVDVVPGQFHVATEFTHLCYFPVFARKSYVVFAHPNSRPPVVEIPVSPKSTAFAYIRAICIFIAILCAMIAPGLYYDTVRKPTVPAVARFWFEFAVTGGIALLALAVTYLPFVTRANAVRAKAIARLIWLPEHVVDQVGAIAGGERLIQGLGAGV